MHSAVGQRGGQPASLAADSQSAVALPLLCEHHCACVLRRDEGLDVEIGRLEFGAGRRMYTEHFCLECDGIGVCVSRGQERE